MSTSNIKRDFRIDLQPMFDLLDFKKSKLGQREWIEYVNATHERIVSNPEQFLGRELPSQAIINKNIEEIFVEYLEEQQAVAI